MGNIMKDYRKINKFTGVSTNHDWIGKILLHKGIEIGVIKEVFTKEGDNIENPIYSPYIAFTNNNGNQDYCHFTTSHGVR